MTRMDEREIAKEELKKGACRIGGKIAWYRGENRWEMFDCFANKEYRTKDIEEVIDFLTEW